MRGKPSPGAVIAIIALVAALAGTASALPGRNTVDGSDIKANSVKRSDIDDDALAPRNQTAVAANPQAGTDPCDAGRTATFCGSTAPAGFWENVGGEFATVSFYADATGVVRLGGSAAVTSASNLGRVFILPAAYRPDGDLAFSVPCGVAEPGGFSPCLVFVDEDGVVYRAGGAGYGMSLDGISFPAA